MENIASHRAKGSSRYEELPFLPRCCYNPAKAGVCITKVKQTMLLRNAYVLTVVGSVVVGTIDSMTSSAFQRSARMGGRAQFGLIINQEMRTRPCGRGSRRPGRVGAHPFGSRKYLPKLHGFTFSGRVTRNSIRLGFSGFY